MLDLNVELSDLHLATIWALKLNRKNRIITEQFPLSWKHVPWHMGSHSSLLIELWSGVFQLSHAIFRIYIVSLGISISFTQGIPKRSGKDINQGQIFHKCLKGGVYHRISPQGSGSSGPSCTLTHRVAAWGSRQTGTIKADERHWVAVGEWGTSLPSPRAAWRKQLQLSSP